MSRVCNTPNSVKSHKPAKTKTFQFAFWVCVYFSLRGMHVKLRKGCFSGNRRDMKNKIFPLESQTDLERKELPPTSQAFLPFFNTLHPSLLSHLIIVVQSCVHGSGSLAEWLRCLGVERVIKGHGNETTQQHQSSISLHLLQISSYR